MADDLIRSTVTRLTGQDEARAVETVDLASKNRLCVESTELITEGISTAEKTITTTAQRLSVGVSNQTDRRGLFLQNIGEECCFIGNSGVTSSNGLYLCGGGTGMFLKVSDSVDVYAICDTGVTTTLRISEVW